MVKPVWTQSQVEELHATLKITAFGVLWGVGFEVLAAILLGLALADAFTSIRFAIREIKQEAQDGQ